MYKPIEWSHKPDLMIIGKCWRCWNFKAQGDESVKVGLFTVPLQHLTVLCTLPPPSNISITVPYLIAAATAVSRGDDHTGQSKVKWRTSWWWCHQSFGKPSTNCTVPHAPQVPLNDATKDHQLSNLSSAALHYFNICVAHSFSPSFDSDMSL